MSDRTIVTLEIRMPKHLGDRIEKIATERNLPFDEVVSRFVALGLLLDRVPEPIVSSEAGDIEFSVNMWDGKE